MKIAIILLFCGLLAGCGGG